MCIST